MPGCAITISPGEPYERHIKNVETGEIVTVEIRNGHTTFPDGEWQLMPGEDWRLVHIIHVGMLHLPPAEPSRTVFEAKADALDLIRRYGGIDGDHHKAWVLDQVARLLAGHGYDRLVEDVRAAGYRWDEGIAP
jgi:hypothetical protein